MTINNLTSCTVSNCNPCDCFDKLSSDELDLIKKNEVVVKYKKGEIICKQGTFASHIMIVQKGLAKVFIDGNDNSLILRIVPESGILGLTSLSDKNSILKYSALAYIDSEIKLIDIYAFKQIVSKNVAFAFEIINMLSANNTQINGRFYCLTYKQSYGKLADILICLADNIFKQRVFELALSRKDLAELSGMSTESVIRMLKKFKDDKIIDMKGKTLKIIDYEKLQEISELG
jgi:CRP/FNR family transcriptional regulator